MNAEQILLNIEQLLPVLQAHHRKGVAQITNDQKLLLRDTYNAIYPGVRVELSCGTCILQYLNMLLSYYQLHKPKEIPPTPQSGSIITTSRKKKK